MRMWPEAQVRGDEAEQRFGQQRGVAHADEVCGGVSGDAQGEVWWPRDGRGLHSLAGK